MREEPVTEREVLRVNLEDGSVKPVRDEVAVECRIELYINGKRHATLLSSPRKVRELAVGRLLSEGVINGLDEVKSLTVSGGKVHIRLSEKSKTPHTRKVFWVIEETAKVRFNPTVILRAVDVLNSKAQIFRRTGGTHASALLDQNGEGIAFSEDVSRRNAVDKVLGEALLKGVDLRATLLASTGRLTSDMVMRAARAGISVMVSTSAPTDRGIEIAEEFGITLIGFTRGSKFNVYTHPEGVLERSRSGGLGTS